MQPVIARITRIASINPWPLVNPEAFLVKYIVAFLVKYILKYIVKRISMPFPLLSDCNRAATELQQTLSV